MAAALSVSQALSDLRALVMASYIRTADEGDDAQVDVNAEELSRILGAVEALGVSVVHDTNGAARSTIGTDLSDYNDAWKDLVSDLGAAAGRIRERREEDRPYRDPSREHRLSASQLGVGGRRAA